jgi:predicted TIM-barrel fold metal-dependent hydrolase
MTSSEIRGIPYSLQISASPWKYPSGGTTFDTLQTCSTQLEQLIRSMDANGIKMATVFAMRRLDDYNEANQYIASSAKKYPDRIIPLARWARFKFTAKKR